MAITTLLDRIKKAFSRQHSTTAVDNFTGIMQVFQGDVIVTELSNGCYIVDDLFKQTFGHPAPTHGNHVVVFCKVQDGSYRVANYLNYWVKDDACYIGGAITDKQVLKSSISTTLLETITAQGGLSKLSIMYTVENQLKQVSAIFGHTEVPRSLQVILELGFVATPEQALYVKWAPEVSEQHKNKLVTQAIAIGPF